MSIAPFDRSSLFVRGETVEVRDRFQGGWHRGYVVDEVTAGGYRVMRTADSKLLPVDFNAGDLRPA